MFNNYFGANQANNALASRTFDEQNVLRQGALQEKFAERSQPLNELIAVLSGTQLQQPNFVNTNISPIPTTDVAGLINTNYQQQLAKAQAEDQNILGGLFGLGSAGIFKWSDERLKEDIRRVGETDDGLGIYFYRYKGDPTPQMGLMAHEVEKRHPAAVIDIGGYKAVNYDMIFQAVEA
jgi:hypothetical protein